MVHVPPRTSSAAVIDPLRRSSIAVPAGGPGLLVLCGRLVPSALRVSNYLQRRAEVSQPALKACPGQK